MAGSAIGGEVVLPRLDVVFSLAAGAIEPFVEVLGAAAFQVGDNEAGIGSFRPDFNPRDDALHPAPALGGIVELHETTHLAAVRRHPGLGWGRLLEAVGGGLLHRRTKAGESPIWGQAEEPIGPVRPTPVEHFRGRVMAVGAQQDLDLGPMAADGADEAAHQAANLHPARPLARPQQRGDKTTLSIKYDDRLEPIIVVVGVEQTELLAAVHPVERIVDIEADALWNGSEAL